MTGDDAAFIAHIRGRRSVRSEYLSSPAPSDAELAEILQAGMSAPDHGMLRPWRFIAVRGAGLTALAELFETALRRREPDVRQPRIDAVRDKILRAPLIVVVYARISDEKPGIPAEERVIATACAAENILLAAPAYGYNGVLLTGWAAQDETVKSGLGIPTGDRIVGFLYLGAPVENTPQTAPQRPDAGDFLRFWP